LGIASVRIEIAEVMEWPAPPPGSFKLPMQQEERAEPMQIAIVGIDLGKNICSLAGLLCP
jgi:hypothetical protein